MSAAMVRRLCGVPHTDRHAILRWRRTRGFPEPWATLRQKKGQQLELWDRRKVRQWLKDNPPVN